jgi:hypothetical protein
MSKKDKKTIVKEIFGKNYIVKNGRKCPIYKCLISEDGGLVSTVIIRRLPNGNFAIGNFMVDKFCLGLKTTSCKVDISMSDLEDFIDEIGYTLGGLRECTYITSHNWIYGGIAYAEDLGFKPDSDFSLTKYFLEDDTDDVELIEFEFGQNGRPIYYEGPYDNARNIIATLIKNIGQDNFDFVANSERF